MPAKIVLDKDLCGGHGVCADEAPEVFELDDDNFVVVKTFEPPPELLDKVRRACAYCPTRAIRVVEA